MNSNISSAKKARLAKLIEDARIDGMKPDEVINLLLDFVAMTDCTNTDLGVLGREIDDRLKS